MMSKKSPQLRFEGFTDDWEERKLGDITKISTGKLDANAMVENGKYDFYTSGIKKYRIDVAAFEGPSITIAGNGATVGYMHLADNKFNAYQRTYVLQEFLVDRSFIFSEIGNKLPKKIKQEARTGNIPYIVMDMLTELKLSIPQNNSEQQKIGSFFKQLDETIALHQRKLDLLKEQKKGYLQKMFPKNGAKVPELRFEGFTDDWEERKLKDISEIIDGDRGKNYPSGDDFKNNGHTLFLSATNVTKQGFVFKKNQYITNLKSESLGNGKVKLNDIILTSRGSIGHIGFYDEKINEKIPQARINSGMLILRTDKFNSPNFIAQFLKSPLGIKQIKLISFGSAQPQLTKKDIKKFKIALPKIEEQQKIGSLLKQIDNTIALHQRKLDLLKEQKKGFLQKMFV